MNVAIANKYEHKFCRHQNLVCQNYTYNNINRKLYECSNSKEQINRNTNFGGTKTQFDQITHKGAYWIGQFTL